MTGKSQESDYAARCVAAIEAMERWRLWVMHFSDGWRAEGQSVVPLPPEAMDTPLEAIEAAVAWLEREKKP